MVNYFGFAPIVTRFQPTTVDTVELSPIKTYTVKIWGFSVSNISAGDSGYTIFTGEDVLTSLTTISSMSLAAGATVVVPIPFIADEGLSLSVTIANTLSFTFWYSQVGA